MTERKGGIFFIKLVRTKIILFIGLTESTFNIITMIYSGILVATRDIKN